MKNLALVTHSKSPKLTDSDQLLVEPLRQEGFAVAPVAWDANTVDWKQFDVVVLRSCWNYHYSYNQFMNWLSILEGNRVCVWNTIPVIRWNVHKQYLKDLEQKHIPIVPTMVIKKKTTALLRDIAIKNNWPDMVIKPAVGASAYGVNLVTEKTIQSSQKKFSMLLDNTDVIVQPLVKEISQGELSFIFFGSQFSHAMIKIPKKGEFRSNYDLGGKEERIKPDKKLIKQASDVLRAISSPLLYARVDGVVINNIFTLMELELIEPHLFFNEDPESPVRFARALSQANRNFV